MSNAKPEELFQQATEAFPYQLDPTSITQGDLEADQDIEYGEEFIFEVGQLLDDKLYAGGWIELRQDSGETTITALFGVARNADWKHGSILPECTGILGDYNTETAEWNLWIDQY